MQELTMEGIAYKSFCSQFGLKPEWLGRTFENRGKTYTITGLNIRSRNFPVQTKEGSSFNAVYIQGLMSGDSKLFERTQKAKHEEKLKQARKNYPSNCWLFNLEKSWLDETFTYRGSTYRIDGVRTNARRFNVLCRKEDNSVAFFPPENIIKLMNEQHPAKKNKKAA
jgi:hypothetical protein